MLRVILFGALLCLPADQTSLAKVTRVVQPEVRRAFYRSGGRYLIGKKIHLHLEGKYLRKQPGLVLPTRRSGELLVFENRSVPVMIHSKNAYWRQVSRHLDDAREFCLKGFLKVPDFDPKKRPHLQIERIKRAPGTWR
jgi:hypothetical protein